MTKAPPVPAANQSPFPLEEPPHTASKAPAEQPAASGSGLPKSLDEGLATAREQVGPLVDQAKQFARNRPWTTAALLGSIALAVANTLRGRR